MQPVHPMQADAYRVRLDAFEGPLDLLLFLIRKAEVDIHDIPIASVTEQYLSFLTDLKNENASRIDIDTAGEFLVMAATLMEIKSRMLMPRPAPIAGENARQDAPEDPRAELVRQLLEYKRYRDAADSLERRADAWRRRFPAGTAGLDGEALAAALEGAREVELEDLELIDLVEAFQKIAETVNFERLGDHQVTYDDTPIELHAEDIVSRLRTETPAGELELGSMFRGRTRSEMVGLFLALLELVRNRRVGVRQDRVEGAILVRLREEPAVSEVKSPEAPVDSPAP
jgi:segregation and condensation protein A